MSDDYKTQPEDRQEEIIDQSEKKRKNWKKEARSWVICIVVTILLAQFILNFVIINANIPSESMENTIMTSDKLIALRTSYWFNDPERGDIAIFKNPQNENEWLIKRVIALPGETVEVKDGKTYINGNKKPLSEPYIREEPNDDFGPITLPSDGYFVMGDNRNHSGDAREWFTPYVKRNKILGKAWFRYFPSFKLVK